MASLRVRAHNVLPTPLLIPELVWLHTRAGTKSNIIIYDAVDAWALGSPAATSLGCWSLQSGDNEGQCLHCTV